MRVLLFLLSLLVCSGYTKAQSADTLRRDSTIYVPKIICPNDGCADDAFRPQYLKTPTEYELLLFDRWGNLMFKSNNPEEFFTGKKQATDITCQEGIYVWRLKYRYETNGSLYFLAGQVTLLR